MDQIVSPNYQNLNNFTLVLTGYSLVYPELKIHGINKGLLDICQIFENFFDKDYLYKCTQFIKTDLKFKGTRADFLSIEEINSNENEPNITMGGLSFYLLFEDNNSKNVEIEIPAIGSVIHFDRVNHECIIKIQEVPENTFKEIKIF